MNKQNSKIGYSAKDFLEEGTKPDKNPTDEKTLQKSPKKTIAKFKNIEIFPIKAITNADIHNGNKQYPNKQTL